VADLAYIGRRIEAVTPVHPGW